MPKPLIQDIIVKKKQIPRGFDKKEAAAKFFKREAEDAWDKAIGGKGADPGKKIKRLKFPHLGFPRFHFGFPRPKSKFKFILGLVALAGLIGASIILLNKFSSLIVEITPRRQYIDVSAVFNASINPQKDELPLEVMQLSREEEGTAPAMGKKQVSRRASGRIVIYNAFTSQPQNLISGTRLETPDAKIYRIDKPITIPGAKIEGGKITASEIELTVYADKPGEEYNIGLTDFIIPGFKDATKREQIYGRSKTEMKGGFIGEVSVVNEKDIVDLDSSLKKKIQDYLLKTSSNPKPDEFLLYDEARQIIFDKQENMPQPGDETDFLKIKENAILLGFLLKKPDINEALAKKYFNPEIAREVEVVNASDLNFELKKFTATAITFSLEGKAHIVWKIDETSLKNDLIKEGDNPESVFLKYPVIEQAKIIFKPSWWRQIPENSSRIGIQLILKENP